MTDPHADESVDSVRPSRRARRSAPELGRTGGIRRPYRLAALFVLPYLLLGIAWIGSNPAGSAPDESDHLRKAIALAELEIGEEFTGPPYDESPLADRIASTSREVSIPSELAPDGFGCTAFQPEQTANCLPVEKPESGGEVERVTAVGAYPPLGYIPLGLAAKLTDSPYHAFIAARAGSLLMSCAMLWLAFAHLFRWLGRKAVLGAVVALTPMSIFVASSVSTSGLEIMSALVVASVAVVCTRHPDSIRDPRTQLTLALGGVLLLSSRQMGVVSLGVFGLVICFAIGWRRIVDLFRRPRPAFIASVLALLLSGAALFVWETRYDHPSHTGSPVSYGALQRFLIQGFEIIRSGIGNFGWLDTPLPRWGIAVWLVLASLICGMALLIGRRADRWYVAGGLLATLAVAYLTYATLFYPVAAGLQGRHMLPLFVFSPLMAGLVVAERLDASTFREAVPRLFAVVALTMPILQWVGLYWNAHRYAVGSSGPVLFLDSAQWEPRFGWVPWLLVGGVGAVMLGVLTFRSRPTANVSGHHQENAFRLEEATPETEQPRTSRQVELL